LKFWHVLNDPLRLKDSGISSVRSAEFDVNLQQFAALLDESNENNRVLRRRKRFDNPAGFPLPWGVGLQGQAEGTGRCRTCPKRSPAGRSRRVGGRHGRVRLCARPASAGGTGDGADPHAPGTAGLGAARRLSLPTPQCRCKKPWFLRCRPALNLVSYAGVSAIA